MLFPITRHQLRNTIKDEYLFDEFKKSVKSIVDQESLAIIQTAVQGKTEHVIERRKYRNFPTGTVQVNDARGMITICQIMTKDEAFDYLLTQFKLNFPDCEYLTDPLKTYILIRW